MSQTDNYMDNLVSVYITNHNYGAYIRQSIESVLNQTFDNYELLIIDDGSTDHSREIIERYRSVDKVKIIFQKNKGLNITNNIAMRAAKGKYIMRLDADDYLDSNALLVMTNALESDDALGLVFPDYYLVDEKGNILSLETRHNFDEEVSLLDQPAHGACTMIRRQFLLELNGYKEDYSCQDGYELWIKFIQKYKVTNINTALFYYRQHGANLTGNEERILSTRAMIKDDYSREAGHAQKAIAILPIRGEDSQNHTTALETVGDRTLLEHKMDQLVHAEAVKLVVVTSPSPVIEEIVNKGDFPDKVMFLNRDAAMAQLNTNLHDTISYVIEEIPEIAYDYLMIMGIEYPFIGTATIQDAVNSMAIFQADSLISVRPETNLFFTHDGHGMKPILNMEKFSRLERESLFKNIGGITVVSKDFFRENKKVLGGQVGHIVISQKQALGIFSKFDLKLARLVHEEKLQAQ